MMNTEMKASRDKLATRKKNEDMQARSAKEEKKDREAHERGELSPSKEKILKKKPRYKQKQCLMNITERNRGNLWAT